MRVRQEKYLYLLILLIGVIAGKCPKDSILQKIQFDYSAIDHNGLRNGQVAVDYEFCIPAENIWAEKVGEIDPDVRILKTSKGRIGCTKEQWLCINSTQSKRWKKKLLTIASLPCVDQIQETFYE